MSDLARYHYDLKLLMEYIDRLGGKIDSLRDEMKWIRDRIEAEMSTTAPVTLRNDGRIE